MSAFVDEADWIGSLDGDYARDPLAYWQENVYLMFAHLFCLMMKLNINVPQMATA